MEHLLDQHLISDKQYGFVKNRSTVTQLLYYLDKCCESTSEGKVIDSIYFDFAKAFDTVPHRRLCKKLSAYGIDGPIMSWIKSFFKATLTVFFRGLNRHSKNADVLKRCIFSNQSSKQRSARYVIELFDLISE